jgi:hypothetical protein
VMVAGRSLPRTGGAALQTGCCASGTCRTLTNAAESPQGASSAGDKEQQRPRQATLCRWLRLAYRLLLRRQVVKDLEDAAEPPQGSSSVHVHLKECCRLLNRCSKLHQQLRRCTLPDKI